MKKILVIGNKGMLGSELYERLSKDPNYTVFGGDKGEINICDPYSVDAIINFLKPDYIINCAAYTNVDGCEDNLEIAYQLNVDAVENLAHAANYVDATLIHISTDYVFDGKLDVNLSYEESDLPHPVSAYGYTKYNGELRAAEANKYYILRTAWLYGHNGKNFVKTMLRLAKDHDEVKVVNDQWGSPTSVVTLCKIIEEILKKNPSYGIYHATGEGFCSWAQFAERIFNYLNLDTKVVGIPSEEYPTPTTRPHNSKLSKKKLHTIGIFPDNYAFALSNYLDNYKEEI